MTTVTAINTNQVIEIREVDGEVLTPQSQVNAAATTISSRTITKALDAAKKE